MSSQTNSLRPSKFFGPTLGTGLLLLIMSIGLAVLASDNFFCIGFGWFTFLIGVMLVLIGTFQNKSVGNPLFYRTPQNRLASKTIRRERDFNYIFKLTYC